MNKQKITYCGSCGKPMKKQEDFGSEQDGVLSGKFCALCYQNGTWTDPDISFNEFYEKSYQGFLNSDMKRIEKFFLKRMYTKKFVAKLERWSK
ncbi:zinc ribbon domain-containing protein [Enterococcus sp. BWB1-3]|uniref:zinc ribbon domain-containing protein n=1 Tax=unclassified Enterococcus TaxID=2608891 RepID=UPI001921D6F3|nr:MULTISPECIES: zinc ribbon domain-containing protein [unclassified Enterococcus]MBL1231070.1 zinc ribbon domain-containing protein [Enterococcus sp. BWB1-3]MCB5955650.1 zinc ribbon domain-containing protein [Enterococcus sp. CWB-B31]